MGEKRTIDAGTVRLCVEHLRDRATGFRQAAFNQRKKVGPLAMAFELAADELCTLGFLQRLPATPTDTKVAGEGDAS